MSHPQTPPDSETRRQALGTAARQLASAAGFSDTLGRTIGACLPALGDFGFFDVVHEGAVRRTVAAHEAPDVEALLSPTRWVRREHPELNLCALSTGEPALHPATDEAWCRRAAADDAHLALLRQLACRSMITVPVRYQGDLLGALTLFMGRSGRVHGPHHLDFAAELATLAAPVVANARLLESERSARAEAEAARRRLELLAGAGEVLAKSLDPDETLDAIARTIVPGIADWCRIDLLDEAGTLQRRAAFHTNPARARQAMEMALALRAAPGTVGSMAWVIAHGRPYYGRFDAPEKLADPALREYTVTFGMHAHFVLPLVARGRTIGAMGVVQAESGRDITPQDRALIQELGQRAALALDNARLYAEAEAARRQAEKASRGKDEFLAMLGHELRNPLAPIATALELMARREPGAAVQERRVIARQVTHLSRLIDDLLDVSRITQGKVQLQRETVDMRQIVENAMELTRPLFERHRNPVALSLPSRPVPVHGDPVRLTQVLCNLLVNAAKFTPPEGHVSLTLEGGPFGVLASVQDDGAGIEAELLPRVFDLFAQGRQPIDRQSGGLGLGLSIVRSMVEMHGGLVTAESAGRGQGSRFTVNLPPAGGGAPGDEPPPAEAPAREPDEPGQARLLLVDDNRDAAETLSELLGMMGYEVRVAGDAHAAMAVLDEFVPQLALLDIGLPEIDGYQLAAMMRGDARTAHVKLVALTGYGAETDRRRALEARFDEHLVKPVSPDQLLGVISRLLA